MLRTAPHTKNSLPQVSRMPRMRALVWEDKAICPSLDCWGLRFGVSSSWGSEARGPPCCPPRMGQGLYLAVGEGKTIRVGDNLQEDIHGVKNGGESGVLAIVLCDLVGSSGTDRRRGSGQLSTTRRQ